MLSNKHAFTLIELLVVVLIIGVLAAVALPQYQKAVLKSKAMQALISATKLWEAQQAYYLEHGTYATTRDELDVQIPADCSLYTSTGFICYAKGRKIAFLKSYEQNRTHCRAYTDNQENTLQEQVCINLGGRLTSFDEELGYRQYTLP